MEIKSITTKYTAVKGNTRIEWTLDKDGSLTSLNANVHDEAGNWLGGYNVNADGGKSANSNAAGDFAAIAADFADTLQWIADNPDAGQEAAEE